MNLKMMKMTHWKQLSFSLSQPTITNVESETAGNEVQLEPTFITFLTTVTHQYLLSFTTEGKRQSSLREAA